VIRGETFPLQQNDEVRLNRTQPDAKLSRMRTSCSHVWPQASRVDPPAVCTRERNWAVTCFASQFSAADDDKVPVGKQQLYGHFLEKPPGKKGNSVCSWRTVQLEIGSEVI
jgi:hypothetical protein